ncbi:MAG: acyltransferase [Patescibacteria group bacterium]
MSERNQFIDFIRGIAIIAMILIHVTVFFPSDMIASTLWNWSQFAVPIFLFCSAYLFIQRDMQREIKLFSYIKKRLVRLVVPYYVFLLFFIPLVFFLTPDVITLNYLLESLLVIGGVDISWLVLLFLMLAALFPLLGWAHKHNKGIFWGYFVVSLSSALFFLFETPDFSYKWIMWLPWSLLFYFAYWYSLYQEKRKHIVLALLFFILVASLTYIEDLLLGQSVSFRENKYPPNMMYLSFGMACILLLSFVTPFLSKIATIRKLIHFFSIYSYDIYFIHYFVLTIFVAYLPQLNWSWWVLFGVVLLITVILQQILIQLRLWHTKRYD